MTSSLSGVSRKINGYSTKFNHKANTDFQAGMRFTGVRRWRCWLTCIDRWRPFDHVEGGSAFAAFLRERPVFAGDAAALQLPIDALKGRRWGLD